MNGKQLKNSILQWAIQGKLVPQDPNDEPASVLLEKIRQEKERLIKEKKIKRDKNASIIYRGEDNSYYEKILATGEVKCIDEEIPFEIPSGWEWCRLSNIGITETGTTPSKTHPEYFGDYIPFLGPANILDDKIVRETQGLSFEGVKYGRVIPANSILQVCIGGSIGKCAIVHKEVTFNQQINSLTPIKCCVDYVHYVLQSETFRLAIMAKATGTATPIINRGNWEQLLFPLPPLVEQHRIVAKLNELKDIVAHYSETQIRLQDLNNGIKSRLSKSILQEAIQGKLVPQDPSDEPASILLQRIRDEKHRLVKEGKLKKKDVIDSTIFRGDDNKYYEQIGKQCEDITEEIPFDLPASWNWTRGKVVFMPMESTKPTSDFIYIDVDAVNNKLNIIDNPKKISIDNVPSRATRKMHQNDILFSMVRPYLRNIAIVDDTYRSAIASTGFYVITPGIGYFPKFLFYLMLSNYVVDGLNTFMKGDNSPSINNGHIENYLYPLPPIKEQQRIVAQIEKLFEQLK